MNLNDEFVIVLPSNAPAGPYTARNTLFDFTIPLDIHAYELEGEWEVCLFDIITPNLQRIPAPLVIKTLELTVLDSRSASHVQPQGEVQQEAGKTLTLSYDHAETADSLSKKLKQQLVQSDAMHVYPLTSSTSESPAKVGVSLRAVRIDHESVWESIPAFKRLVDRPRHFGYNVPAPSDASPLKVQGPTITSVADLTHQEMSRRDTLGIDHFMPKRHLSYEIEVDKEKFYYEAPGTEGGVERMGGHLIVVTCNVVDPASVILGANTLPCLRILPIVASDSAKPTLVQYPLKGLVWVPVCVSRLDTINISLTDELGDPLAFPPASANQKVQVTLKFRRVDGGRRV